MEPESTELKLSQLAKAGSRRCNAGELGRGYLPVQYRSTGCDIDAEGQSVLTTRIQQDPVKSPSKESAA